MGRRSERARQVLMDAAEELFARDGVDVVSNRRITEHAGASNHSAVTYHFGNRDELIQALLQRHLGDMAQRRAELVAALDPDAGLWDLVACRILPMVEGFDALPRPSWRARFLNQVNSLPSLQNLLIGSHEGDRELWELGRRAVQAIDGVTPTTFRARSSILGHLVLGVCAKYEAEVEAGIQQGTWIDVGHFLTDAVTGMLSAPVTHRSDYTIPVSSPLLL
ncbi:TetR/AcrR family transcriptional regulator [Corynebacterium glutamicum]|uniref:TetR/AcrR family transcriptional regulator n=1 Tax=Corynebacterium glutamicum TaxID=1718 RepID=UPI001B8D2152|nr:TetR/AcrR family transcriptional regulator [Corynebacterium glutamicum]